MGRFALMGSVESMKKFLDSIKIRKGEERRKQQAEIPAPNVTLGCGGCPLDYKSNPDSTPPA